MRPADEIYNAKPQYLVSLVNTDNAKPDFRTVVLRSARDGVVLAASWVPASRNGATRAEEYDQRVPGRDVRDRHPARPPEATTAERLRPRREWWREPRPPTRELGDRGGTDPKTRRSNCSGFWRRVSEPARPRIPHSFS